MAHERLFDIPRQGIDVKGNALYVTRIILDLVSIVPSVRLAWAESESQVSFDNAADAQAFFDLWVQRIEDAR